MSTRRFGHPVDPAAATCVEYVSDAWSTKSVRRTVNKKQSSTLVNLLASSVAFFTTYGPARHSVDDPRWVTFPPTSSTSPNVTRGATTGSLALMSKNNASPIPADGSSAPVVYAYTYVAVGGSKSKRTRRG